MSDSNGIAKVDVFVRVWLPSDGRKKALRKAMAAVCWLRWEMQDSVNLDVIIGGEADPEPQFHMNAKRYAEEHATTEVYVIADDDCLILGRDFIEKGVATLQAHPEYGLLTAVSISDGGYRAATDATDADVIEMHAVGGVCFVRKGVLKGFDFPACDVNKTDETICNEVNRRGLKTGVMPRVKFNHIGACYSLSSEGYWFA